MTLTINTSATCRQLTTVDVVKDELELASSGSTDDDFLEQLINEASDFIATYTGRVFPKQNYTETMASDGGLFLMTTNTPLLSIDVISLKGSTVSSTTYEIDNKEAGIIWSNRSWQSTQLVYQYIEAFPLHEGRRDWSITYDAGYEVPGSTAPRTLPYDIERACIDMVKTNYLRRCEDTRIRHQSVDETFEILVNEPLTPSTLKILERYRRISV